MAVDLVIRNGTVIDGTGAPGRRADVGVRDGVVVAVGEVDERANRTIDAEGHVVTPGFVDGHTHFDAQLFWNPLGTNSSLHGITTVVMGNCGFTLAPVRDDAHELVVRNLERAEDMAPDTLAAGVPWSWSTFPEYLDAVDRVPLGINHAANIGHSSLRTWVMGERAFTDDATDDELAAMRSQIRIALRAGAVGFTTSRATHETSDDRPVASRRAPWAEVRALVGVLGEERRGVFQLAPELGLQYGVADPDLAMRRDFQDRIAALAVESGARIALPIPAMSGFESMLDVLDRTAPEGEIFGLSHSRGIQVVLSFRTQLPFDSLPAWQAIRALPLEGQRAALVDPDTRRRLVAATHQEEYRRAIGVEARPPDFDTMRVLVSPYLPNPTVREEAQRRGVDPVDAMIDLALESDFDVFFVQPLSVESPDDRLRIMRHPRTVMTFSDSGAHVSQIVDSSIQTHLLAYWVRELGAFSLEDAVRMLTSVPARAWRLPGRGVLRPGMAADVNVFDPATVGPELPEVRHDLPAGGVRLTQGARGFRATVVNGQVLFEDGEPTGELGGRLLRGPFVD